MIKRLSTLRRTAKATFSKVTDYFPIYKLIHLFFIPSLLDLSQELTFLTTPSLKTSPVASASPPSLAPFYRWLLFRGCPLMVGIALFQSSILLTSIPRSTSHLDPTPSVNSSRFKPVFRSFDLPPKLLSHPFNTGMNISAWRLHWWFTMNNEIHYSLWIGCSIRLPLFFWMLLPEDMLVATEEAALEES